MTFTGKVLETLYHVTDREGGCDEACPNLNAVDHWQSFVTGPETAYIKFASSHVHGDGLTMKYSIHSGGPDGPQVGPAIFATNPATAGDLAPEISLSKSSLGPRTPQGGTVASDAFTVRNSGGAFSSTP